MCLLNGMFKLYFALAIGKEVLQNMKVTLYEQSQWLSGGFHTSVKTVRSKLGFIYLLSRNISNLHTNRKGVNLLQLSPCTFSHPKITTLFLYLYSLKTVYANLTTIIVLRFSSLRKYSLKIMYSTQLFRRVIRSRFLC